MTGSSTPELSKREQRKLAKALREITEDAARGRDLPQTPEAEEDDLSLDDPDDCNDLPCKEDDQNDDMSVGSETAVCENFQKKEKILNRSELVVNVTEE